jgi:predicted ribosome quality control (RQC) complex YloA/Tae2 family protein
MDFRRIITDRETIILCGKNAINNEELIKQVKKEEEVFHTLKPGSGFANIKGRAKKGDLKQAAIFCAAYSKDWKKNKLDVVIHRFKGKDIYKLSNMKTGTFGLKKFKKIKIKKEEIKEFLKLWGK